VPRFISSPGATPVFVAPPAHAAKGMLRASYSSRYYPTPAPSMNRPLEKEANTAHDLANAGMLWSGKITAPVPSRNRVVLTQVNHTIG